MTIYVENETDFTFPFDTKELCSRVAEAVLDAECPVFLTLFLLAISL